MNALINVLWCINTLAILLLLLGWIINHYCDGKNEKQRGCKYCKNGGCVYSGMPIGVVTVIAFLIWFPLTYLFLNSINLWSLVVEILSNLF